MLTVTKHIIVTIDFYEVQQGSELLKSIIVERLKLMYLNRIYGNGFVQDIGQIISYSMGYVHQDQCYFDVYVEFIILYLGPGGILEKCKVEAIEKQANFVFLNKYGTDCLKITMEVDPEIIDSYTPGSFVDVMITQSNLMYKSFSAVIVATPIIYKPVEITLYNSLFNFISEKGVPNIINFSTEIGKIKELWNLLNKPLKSLMYDLENLDLETTEMKTIFTTELNITDKFIRFINAKTFESADVDNEESGVLYFVRMNLFDIEDIILQNWTRILLSFIGSLEHYGTKEELLDASDLDTTMGDESQIVIDNSRETEEESATEESASEEKSVHEGGDDSGDDYLSGFIFDGITDVTPESPSKIDRGIVANVLDRPITIERHRTTQRTIQPALIGGKSTSNIQQKESQLPYSGCLKSIMLFDNIDFIENYIINYMIPAFNYIDGTFYLIFAKTILEPKATYTRNVRFIYQFMTKYMNKLLLQYTLEDYLARHNLIFSGINEDYEKYKKIFSVNH